MHHLRPPGRRRADQPTATPRRRRLRRPSPYPPSRGSIPQSFNHAFQGLVYVFWHQRNTRVHFLLALGVLLASLLFDLSRVELLVVLAAITFVLVAEMLNTALESAIDLFTGDYDPRAKIAKDVAAGAVLIAAVNALLVAYFVFADRVANVSLGVLTALRRSPSHLTFITFLIVILLVIVVKARAGRGQPLSGGLPSGHAAVAFAGWAAVTMIAAGTPHWILISAVAFAMAGLTAQTRVQTGIHTTLEVTLGAILGIVVTVLLFQLLP